MKVKVILFLLMFATPAMADESIEFIYPEDRILINQILQNAKRLKEIELERRERSASLPVCPIEPGTYWNLECV
jgi:hypothetical protein